jgi:crotonobetainyl-CoA:carnitine CoA-transferase CaiB-like acyl-CoA transferase
MAQPYLDWSAALFDPTKIFGRPEALRDLRVLDLGTIFLGPTTTTYLGEYGAEVIKVEIPGVGDTIRALGPTYHWNMSLIGLSEPKNKYFAGLDVRKRKGRELFPRARETGTAGRLAVSGAPSGSSRRSMHDQRSE